MTETKKPAIVLGIEPRITVPLARSLWRLGVPVIAASMSASDPRLRSRAIRHFVRLPHADASRSFISALSSCIKANGADMLIPITDTALQAIGTHYGELSVLLHVACPPPDAVNRVLNKQATLAIAARCGIRIPREYVVEYGADLSALSELAFPLVAKPRQKSSTEAFKVRYFYSAAELREAIAAGILHDTILQEYCHGEGVGVEMLVHRGACIAAFQHRRLAEFPHTGGVAVKAVAEAPDPQLRDIALQLLRALQWEGVAMVEFRHDRRTGSTALMEVNGRYWGSLSLPLQAGVDFPAYQWQLAHGITPEVPANYRFGTVWRWSAGSLKSWHGRLRSRHRGQEMSPPSDPPSVVQGKVRDALWSSSDRWPAVFELLRTANTLLRSDARALLKSVLPKRALAALRARKVVAAAALQRDQH